MNVRAAAGRSVISLVAVATSGLALAAPAPAVTIFSSLPLHGGARPSTTQMVKAMQLALADAGGKAGGIPVTFRSLDSSTAQAGGWVPEKVVANARRACDNIDTAIYLGDYSSVASTVSIPMLNDCGVPQISASNTSTGVTRAGAGADRGEPDMYYPTGIRTYARIVPNDRVQAAALVTAMQDESCQRVAIAHDGEVFGGGLTSAVRQDARRLGLRVVTTMRIDAMSSRYRKEASRARRLKADCFLYSGITANNAIQLFRDVARTLPSAKLFGGDGIVEPAFSDPSEGGVPASIGRRIRVTMQLVDPTAFAQPGLDFYRRFGAREPDAYAIYAYEAMSLALDAIARSGTGARAHVRDALFATKDRPSLLGTYSIDANGDTTLRDYGLYRIRGGEFEYARTVVAR